MHYYVGIDIAKTFHVACVVNQDDKVIKKSLKFNNDESGFITPPRNKLNNQAAA
jgi:transposase